MRRICMFAALLVLILACVFVMSTQVQAAEEEPEIIYSGICGDNLTWTLDDEGTLTISGEGDMYDYWYMSPDDDFYDPYVGDNLAPWNETGRGEERVKTVVIANGVTSIGSCAFKQCIRLKLVYIPDTVTSIGFAAFDCTGFRPIEDDDGFCIWHVMYEGTEREWNAICLDAENWELEYVDTIHYNCNGTEVVNRETKACNICDCTHITTNTVTENVVDATCVKDGSYDEVVYCSECCREISRTTHTASASGHAWDDGVCTTCGATCVHNYEDGICTECGYECPHNYEDSVCIDCGYECPHSYEDGICAVCGYICAHNWDAGVYTPATNTENGYTTYICNDCSVTKRIDDVIPPEINTDDMEEPEGDAVTDEEKNTIIDRIEQAEDDIKIVVGFEDQKNKDKLEEIKEKNPDLKDETPKLHIAAKKMFITGDKATKIVYDVTPMLGDQKLELGAEITFRLPVDANTDVLYAYVFHEDECLGKFEIHGSAEDGKYVVVTAKEFSLYAVDTSGHEWKVSITEPTYTTMGEQATVCEQCGEVYNKVSIPAKFYGTSINLGNTLDMYFGFYTGLVDEEGTVKFVREFADGTTETTEAPITAFNKNNSIYDITYTGLAAKEMCDTIYIYIYNGDGELVGEHSDSIRSYLLRQLREKEYGAQFRTLCVDLLNYGAAAQVAFDYAADDLANKDLTVEELAEGTQTVAEYTNKQTITGTAESYYYGTAYILEEKISMAMAVKAECFDEGCYALISYTDHMGTEKADIRLEGKLNNSVYEFIFNEMVVADGRCLLTMEFYKADGTLVVTVQDSMESYTARKAAEYPLAEKMLAFSDSAYAYLHREEA